MVQIGTDSVDRNTEINKKNDNNNNNNNEKKAQYNNNNNNNNNNTNNNTTSRASLSNSISVCFHCGSKSHTVSRCPVPRHSHAHTQRLIAQNKMLYDQVTHALSPRIRKHYSHMALRYFTDHALAPSTHTHPLSTHMPNRMDYIHIVENATKAGACVCVCVYIYICLFMRFLCLCVCVYVCVCVVIVCRERSSCFQACSWCRATNCM